MPSIIYLSLVKYSHPRTQTYWFDLCLFGFSSSTWRLCRFSSRFIQLCSGSIIEFLTSSRIDSTFQLKHPKELFFWVFGTLLAACSLRQASRCGTTCGELARKILSNLRLHLSLMARWRKMEAVWPGVRVFFEKAFQRVNNSLIYGQIAVLSTNNACICLD